MKQAGVTDLGCKVSCVPVLMTGPHWTHSDSGILTGLPRRPAGSALGSPISLCSSSHALSSVCRHSGVGLPRGLSPAPPQISAGPAALFLSGLCQNVSLVNAPAPPSVGNHHPPPLLPARAQVARYLLSRGFLSVGVIVGESPIEGGNVQAAVGTSEQAQPGLADPEEGAL